MKMDIKIAREVIQIREDDEGVFRKKSALLSEFGCLWHTVLAKATSFIEGYEAKQTEEGENGIKI